MLFSAGCSFQQVALFSRLISAQEPVFGLYMPVAQEPVFGLYYASCSGAGFWPLCQLLRSRFLAFMPVAQTWSLSESFTPSISLTESLTYSASPREPHSVVLTQRNILLSESALEYVVEASSLPAARARSPQADHRRGPGSSITVVVLPRRTPSGDRDRSSTTVVVSTH